jgi:hypothetical protein
LSSQYTPRSSFNERDWKGGQLIEFGVVTVMTNDHSLTPWPPLDHLAATSMGSSPRGRLVAAT